MARAARVSHSHSIFTRSTTLIVITDNRVSTVAILNRVSNLKYESVRIDSKTVVFIRANPGKKENTEGSG